LDYFGRWKALHYAARRFFAPVLLSAEDEGTAVSLHVTNDQADAWDGRVRWSLETLAGDVIDQGEERVQAPSVCAVAVRELELSAQVTCANRREIVLVHELWRGDERLSMGVVPFVADKHLKLQDPGIRYDIIAGPGGFEIELTAERLARYVWLELPGSDIVFSDNYFDIPAGRTVRVSVAAEDGMTADQVRSALRVRSLTDSY
jgi:beta-mannosidase